MWKCCSARCGAGVSERDVAAEFIEREIEPAAEAAHQRIGAAGDGLFVFFTAGEHERNAGFVDQDGIGLVDHGGVERAVDLIFEPQRQMVAQKVEADFVGGGVGDVAGVGARGALRRLLDC